MTDPIALAIRAGCDAGGWTHGCRYPKCEDDGPTHGCSRSTEIKTAIAAYEAQRATDTSDLEYAARIMLTLHPRLQPSPNEIRTITPLIADARQAAARELDELRRAVAELIGQDPETWPKHGNVPLAIAASMLIGLTHTDPSDSGCLR